MKHENHQDQEIFSGGETKQLRACSEVTQDKVHVSSSTNTILCDMKLFPGHF